MPIVPVLEYKSIIVHISKEQLNKCPSVDMLRSLSVEIAKSTMSNELKGFMFSNEVFDPLELNHRKSNDHISYFVILELHESEESFSKRLTEYQESMDEYKDWMSSSSRQISNEVKKRSKKT